MAETRIPASDLIASYLAAFSAANGRDYNGTLTYEKGWFVFRSGLFKDRYRASELAAMKEVLLGRAALQETASG